MTECNYKVTPAFTKDNRVKLLQLDLLLFWYVMLQLISIGWCFRGRLAIALHFITVFNSWGICLQPSIVNHYFVTNLKGRNTHFDNGVMTVRLTLTYVTLWLMCCTQTDWPLTLSLSQLWPCTSALPHLSTLFGSSWGMLMRDHHVTSL